METGEPREGLQMSEGAEIDRVGVAHVRLMMVGSLELRAAKSCKELVGVVRGQAAIGYGGRDGYSGYRAGFGEDEARGVCAMSVTKWWLLP